MKNFDFLIEWLGYFFAFIGFLATVYKSIERWLNIHKLSWNEVDKYAKKIAKSISNDKYHPDVIVTIGRGGAIFGSLLSGCIHKPNILYKNTPLFGTDRLYDWEDNQRVEIKNKMINYRPLRDKRILLVAGDVMSGSTMKFTIDELEEKGVKDIKTVCIVKSKSTTLIPDYFGKEIASDFKMPWMYKKFHYARDSRTPN